MNISGIRTYAGFYDYNTIKNSEARSQQIQDAKAGEKALPETSQNVPEEKLPMAGQDMETAQKQSEGRPDTGASEYVKQYQPDAVYDLKGEDSDIARLDVEKALSDMKKDQVLQQYQFFIGEKKAGEGLTDSRENENFSL